VPGTGTRVVGAYQTVAEKNQGSGSPREEGEVVVVGASAAGLYAAGAIARGGRQVRVLESKASFDPPARTLIVTNHFRNQLGSMARESIVNEIRRFELFTDGRSAQIALTKPDLIVERSRLISTLARDAQGAGAKVSFDTLQRTPP
jgi:flavin-dependent dehydrogenase